MKVSGVLILAGLLGLAHGPIAFAKDAASVKILSPANNERLDAGEGPAFTTQKGHTLCPSSVRGSM